VKGKLITIEGGEGSGKTTQLTLLKESIRTSYPSQFDNFVFTSEPGGTELGQRIRTLVLGNNSITPLAELLLFQSDRAQHIQQVIKPALDNGKNVVCDRFTDSTIVYQGFGRGIPLEVVQRLNYIATSGIEPDLTILLDIDVEEGLKRKTDLDSIEREDFKFHCRVNCGYKVLASVEPRIKVIDASLRPNAIAYKVRELIRNLIFGESYGN